MEPSKTFAAYCRTLTDDQCLAVLEKEREGAERDPDRKADYYAAVNECAIRGLIYTGARSRRFRS